jgi:hypothetical protein
VGYDQKLDTGVWEPAQVIIRTEEVEMQMLAGPGQETGIHRVLSALTPVPSRGGAG